jgi:hypothetical protein
MRFGWLLLLSLSACAGRSMSLDDAFKVLETTPDGIVIEYDAVRGARGQDDAAKAHCAKFGKFARLERSEEERSGVPRAVYNCLEPASAAAAQR